MNEYVDHFQKVLSFLREHQNLVDCHLVDFITDNLWEKCLPEKLRLQLQETKLTNYLKNKRMQDDIGTELHNFLKCAKSLAMDACPFLLELKDIPAFLSDHCNIKLHPNEGNNNKGKFEFMKNKKRHEVEILAGIISKLSQLNSSIVIDIGAGKGYLSTYISENYGIPVLAIDSSKTCHNGSLKRQQLMRKKNAQSTSLVHYLVHHVNENTDYFKLIKENCPNYEQWSNVILTGLHTCGSLSLAILRTFINSEQIKSLCVVSCCYHLTQECLNGQYEFSKNARMLAQQSMERISKKEESLSPSLFYRAVLQVLLQSMGKSEIRIGRGAPLKNFPTYAIWALKKIGIHSEEIPSEKELEDLYTNYIELEWKMNIFQLLRVYMGSVLEAAIQLERVIYLQQISATCK
ncbi:methyltransferase-like protein 25 isoform X2 [Orussus abietinus]|uniref:methyltransferase-like protein 25 isoform X2 n=1 Tax=Orussus abietinus TaxID=222816 RepID=UPI00062518EA|nr:methyltransferase-like protein 25 isoform X2 [Orussus abietinus]